MLPVIESVVHTSILPAMEQHYRIHGAFDPNSMFREGPPFLGLNEVLGAYWLLATPNPGRAIEFIRSTPWAVEGEAICALVTQYNPHRSVERPDIPTAYCDYLHSLRDNPNPEISRMAKFAIKRLALDKIPS